jgi:hypothetical protein
MPKPRSAVVIPAKPLRPKPLRPDRTRRTVRGLRTKRDVIADFNCGVLHYVNLRPLALRGEMLRVPPEHPPLSRGFSPNTCQTPPQSVQVV